MERLTIKAPSGLIHLKDNKEMTVNAAIKKLSDYEDLEEQGKLLKLPCAVGDTVYTIYSGFIEESNVEEVSTHRIWIDSMYFDYADIGKTVFLTRKEAEAALKKMEKNHVKSSEQ